MQNPQLWTALAAAVVAATPTPASAAQKTAVGAFEVRMTAQSASLMAMAKRYSGALAGEGSGPFVGDPKIMVYVALETFQGALDGRRGSFIMMHRGWQAADKSNHLDVVIAPNSGTAELAGISGSLDIRIDAKGGHFYTLRYELPASR